MVMPSRSQYYFHSSSLEEEQYKARPEIGSQYMIIRFTSDPFSSAVHEGGGKYNCIPITISFKLSMGSHDSVSLLTLIMGEEDTRAVTMARARH